MGDEIPASAYSRVCGGCGERNLPSHVLCSGCGARLYGTVGRCPEKSSAWGYKWRCIHSAGHVGKHSYSTF